MINKRNRSKRVISLILVVILLLTVTLSGTQAWASFDQNIINQFLGNSYQVMLTKYETGTNTVLQNAEFELYQQTGNKDKKIGIYLTDERGQILITDLEAGSYYFLETAAPYGYQYAKENARYDFQLTKENGKVEIKAYNERQKADLTITKTVEGEGADKEKEFRFLVLLGDEIDQKKDNQSTEEESVKQSVKVSQIITADVKETPSYIYLIDGVEQGLIKNGDMLVLKHGQTAVIKDIPAGTFYEVQEQEEDGYLESSVHNSGNLPAGGVTAAFTNKYDPGVMENGSLSLTKIVSGEGGDETKQFNFHLKIGKDGNTAEYSYLINGQEAGTVKSGDIISLSHGQTALIEGIPVDTIYSITEDDYQKEGYVTVSEGASGSIAAGVEAKAVFTNTREPEEKETGMLTVQKSVEGEGADLEKDFTFTVRIGDKVETITLKNGESYDFVDIPVGTSYLVVENDYRAEGYITSSDKSSGTITKEKTTASFVNTYVQEKGDLIVKKTVYGDNPSTDQSFEFTVLVGTQTYTFRLQDGQEYRISGIPFGTPYSVTEKDYTAQGFLTESQGASGTIAKPEQRAEFMNTAQTIPDENGSLKITKTVVGEGADTKKEFRFTVQIGDRETEEIILKSGEEKIYTDIPVGTTFVILEDDYYEEGYITTTDNTTGTILPGETTASFTNSYQKQDGKPGNLVVEKIVKGEQADKEKMFQINVTIGDKTETVSLKGGESHTFENIPEGTYYEVVEDDYYAEGYTTSTTNAAGHILNGTNHAVVTNTIDSSRYGNLTVAKQLEGDSADKKKEFSFTVTIGDKTETLVLKGGESHTYSNIPVGTPYKVEEADYTADGYITTTTGTAGNIVAGAQQAVIINILKAEQTGSLTVMKQLEGAGADPQKEFTFTVLIGDKTETLVLKGGESYTYENILAGTLYRVTEKDYSGEGYLGSISGGEGHIIAAGNQAVQTNTNIQAAMITIDGEKTWDHGSNPEANRPKRVTIRLMVGDTIYASMEVSADNDWKYSFTVPKYEADGVTEISYTISEAPVKDYEMSTDGSQIKNTYKPEKKVSIEPQIEKVLKGDIPVKNETFTFVLKPITENAPMPAYAEAGKAQVTIDGAGKVYFDRIQFEEAGVWQYEITEIKGKTNGYVYDEAIYLMTVTVEENEDILNADITYEKDGIPEEQIVFTNQYQSTPEFSADLTVIKHVAGEGADKEKQFVFTAVIGDSETRFSLKDGESKTFSNLPVGTKYTVREESHENYITSSVNSDGTISRDGEKVIFTNQYQKDPIPEETGELTLTKLVKGAGADINKKFDFTVKVGTLEYHISLKDKESYTIKNLPAGEAYNITEADYSEEGYITSSENAAGTIVKSGVSAVFTNTYDTTVPGDDTGELMIKKKVSGEGADKEKTFNFHVQIGEKSYSFKLKDGEEMRYSNLPVGTSYVVTEDDYTEDGYIMEAENDRGIIIKESKTVLFTNTYHGSEPQPYGMLTVTKNVTGEGADPGKNFTFKVTLNDKVEEFTLSHGESRTFGNIPIGTKYLVEEMDYKSEGYQTTSTGSTGTITKTASIAAFTNTFEKAEEQEESYSLTIKKKTAGTGASKEREFKFHVIIGQMNYEISLKDGESKTFTGITKGTSYQVTEEDYTGDGYVTVSKNEQGTFQKQDITVTFTNTYQKESKETGSLTVEKKVTGEGAEKNKRFTFHVTLGDASETFTLKHGEKKTFTNLPVDMKYIVTEEAADGYSTVSQKSTGTIIKKGVHCTFINTADKKTDKKDGSLTVTKTLAGADPDTNKEFEFTAAIGNISYDFKLKGGEEKIFTKIPAGTAYSVTEKSYVSEGYRTVSNGAAGTITEDGATAAFTNTYVNGSASGGGGTNSNPGGNTGGSSNGTSGNKTAKNAKTSDETPIGLFIGLILISGAAGILIFLKQKRKKE